MSNHSTQNIDCGTQSSRILSGHYSAESTFINFFSSCVSEDDHLVPVTWNPWGAIDHRAQTYSGVYDLVSRGIDRDVKELVAAGIRFRNSQENLDPEIETLISDNLDLLI